MSYDRNSSWPWFFPVEVSDPDNSLDWNDNAMLGAKLDALMEHLGLEFKKVPEKLEVKKKG